MKIHWLLIQWAVNNQEEIAESDGPDESVTTTNVDSNDDEYAWLCMRYAEPEDLEKKAAVNCV